MEQPFIVKIILHHFTLFVAITAGAISFRKLSVGQKIIWGECCLTLSLGIWTAIRIYYGFYSTPIVSTFEFICYGIELVYIDYELGAFRKKKLFRILGVFLLSLIPLNWIYCWSLNYRGASQILISLYLITFYFYCIIYRPANHSNMILRWALLFYVMGNFLHATFKDFIIWKLEPELSRTISNVSYRLGDIEFFLITISFLMAYFQKKKTLQFQE
jgi:hypothetical protein